MVNPDDFPQWDATVLTKVVGANPAIQQRILQKFATSAVASLQQLAADCANADWIAVAATAHRLKSSARTVGALQMGAWCECLERASVHGQVGDGPALLASIQKAYTEVESRLNPAA